jgi:hypothetical protein
LGREWVVCGWGEKRKGAFNKDDAEVEAHMFSDVRLRVWREEGKIKMVEIRMSRVST